MRRAPNARRGDGEAAVEVPGTTLASVSARGVSLADHEGVPFPASGCPSHAPMEYPMSNQHSPGSPASSQAVVAEPGDNPTAGGPLRVLKALGPGLISGASDNDPTTVATLAVVGATTVYGLSWLVVLLFPLLSTIQILGARVGVVAGTGLQRASRLAYGRAWGIVLLCSVLVVSLITIGADLEGGAAALALLLPGDWQWYVGPFALATGALLVAGSYAAVSRVLKCVLLVFIAYVGAALAAHPDWARVMHDTVHPPISTHGSYVEAALALLGTTLTSYAYVWETIEEGEEAQEAGPRRLKRLGLAQADAGAGMFLAVAIFWFILIATGATLGVHGQTVQTAQDAARALVPVAGPAAGTLFALGLLASAILAVPVLAASSAYIVAEEFGWRRGLSEPVRQARGFYAVLLGALLIGVGIAAWGVSPITLLFWSGIAGGLGTPISLVFLLLVARNRAIMGQRRAGPLLTGVGWATAIMMAAISAVFLYQQFVG